MALVRSLQRDVCAGRSVARQSIAHRRRAVELRCRNCPRDTSRHQHARSAHRPPFPRRYVRIKRKTTTVFLHVEPSDNFASVKARCAKISNISPSSIMLYASDKQRELVDLATVGDQEIPTESIVYMVFKKDGSDTFEDIDVAGPAAN